MDKLSESFRLKSATTVPLADRAGFLRHMRRQYPDSFSAQGDCFTMGLASAAFMFADTHLRVEVSSEDAGDLGILKGIIAYHLQNWPGSDRLSVVWTGDGVDGGVLPHFRAMRLAGCEWLTPRLCRVLLEGDDLHRFTRGGWHVRLLLPPEGREPVWPQAGPGALPIWPAGADRLALRTYTLRHVEPEAGRVAVDVVMHQPEGVMTEWVRRARTGAPIGMMGPGGGEITQADWVCLAGDETGLPAIARGLERLDAATRGHAVIEVDTMADEIPLQAPPGVSIHWIYRDGAPAGTCPALGEVVSTLDWPSGGSIYAFSGTEFSAYRVLRHEFRKVRRLKRHQHLAMAYWRRGVTESG